MMRVKTFRLLGIETLAALLVLTLVFLKGGLRFTIVVVAALAAFVGVLWLLGAIVDANARANYERGYRAAVRDAVEGRPLKFPYSEQER